MENQTERGRNLVLERLVLPMLQGRDRYIGVELEYPLIPLGNGNSEAVGDVSDAFLRELVETLGFAIQIRGTDGRLVRVKSPCGDAVSFDLHYGQIEFSMWRDLSLTAIAVRFYPLLRRAAAFYRAHGFLLTGLGTNPKADPRRFDFTSDDFARYIGGFLTQYTSYRDMRFCFTNMYSTQTHLEVEGARFFDTLNLMTGLNFVSGLLFSNSLPHPATLPPGKRYPAGILCARDYNWKYSEFPATGLFDRAFADAEQLADYIADMELLLDREPGSGRIVPIPRTGIRRYFDGVERPDDNFGLFRMFSHVALNHYHTLELRADCVQPVQDAFSPSAFHLGIARGGGAVRDELARFRRDQNLDLTASVLRELAVTGAKIAPPAATKAFLRRLLAISRAQLTARGYGEERFLDCLEERVDTLRCPAKAMRDALDAGEPLEALMERYGAADGVPYPPTASVPEPEIAHPINHPCGA